MKRSPSLILFSLATTGSLLAGCGGDSDDPAGPDAQPERIDAAPDLEPMADAAPPDPIRVSNIPEDCVFDNAIGPILPDEAGHFAGTALTPPSYPFRFERVGYVLGGENDCTTALAHEVIVFAASEMPPSNNPSDSGGRTLAVPAGADVNGDRVMEVDLGDPITVSQGALVVAVKLVAAGDESLCLRSCATGGESGEDWWSNAAAEPFAWADMLDAFGFTSQFAIDAVGRPE